MDIFCIGGPTILASILYFVYRVFISRRLPPESSTSLSTLIPLRSTKPSAPEQTAASKPLAPRSLKLDTLPFDICLEIFSYLSVPDLCVIENTSKSLFQMIRHRHTWSRVISDIHQVKPLAYHTDLLTMTADELRAMAIRAVQLHHAMSQTFTPKRLTRAPLSINFVVYRMYSYPRGRCIAAGKLGELALFSTRDGSCLDSVPRLYESTPAELVRDHWTTPAVISASQAYVFHVVNCEEDVYIHGRPRSRFKEATIRLFSVEDRTILLQRELCVDHEIISVSAGLREWAYVSWEEQARGFFLRLFPLSDDSNIPSEGNPYHLRFLAESPRQNPVTVAFVSDRHIMLADHRSICVYLVPDSLTTVSTLEPIWQHVDGPRSLFRIPPKPRVSIAPPSPENLDVLRFSLYSDGCLRTVRVSLPDSGTIDAIDMFLPEYSIYSLGVTSVVIPDYSGDKHYRSISFLYASSAIQYMSRFNPSDDILVHGDLRLFVDDECQLPRALCLDEENGVLIAADFEFLYTYPLTLKH